LSGAPRAISRARWTTAWSFDSCSTDEETTTMADSTDFMTRGREVAGKLWGTRAGGQELPAQRLAPDFFALVTQFVFGGFWARPNLDLRSRSLCTVAQLAALGKLDELKGHLHGALNLGISREELIEVLMQTACYAGVPAAVQALNAAADILAPRS
jgi:4-carboxymuconolactone decarboxylase